MTKLEAAKQRYKNRNKTKEDEKISKTSTSQKSKLDSAKQRYKAKSFGLDTLESDLESLGQTVQGIYDGWQTEETMNNTRSAVESMMGRLDAYSEYQKTYGGADLTELTDSYKSVLDDWDKRAELYGQFKNPDAYNAAATRDRLTNKFRVKTGNVTYRGLTFDEVQEELKKYAPDSDEYKFLSNYTGYTDLADFEKAIASKREYAKKLAHAKNTKGGLTEKAVKAKKGYEKFLTDEELAAIKGGQGDEDYLKQLEMLGGGLEELVAAQEKYRENESKIQEDNYYAEKAASGEGKAGYDKFLKDKALADKQKADKEANTSWFERAVEGMAMTSQGGEMGTSLNAVIDAKREDTSYQLPTEDWTEEELYEFGARYGEKPTLAYDYAANLNNAKAMEKQNQKAKKHEDAATSGFWSGAWETAKSVIASPTALYDFMDDLTDVAAGRNVIVEEGSLTPFEYSQSVRGAIGEKLNEVSGTLDSDIPIIGGKGLGDLYGVATSIADSATSAYLLGGTGTLVNYFGQGAASGVDEAISRGATPEQALSYGVALGAAEGIFESIGVENLFKIGASNTLKEFIVNVGKQAGVEGIEETLTSLAGNIADDLVMQEKSNYNLKVKEYMSKGLSRLEAEKKAWVDTFEEVAYEGLSGFISGGAHAGPHAAIQSIKQKRRLKSAYSDSDSLDVLIAEGLESDENTLSHKLAVEYQETIANGGSLSGGDISRLVNANQDAIKSEIRTDAESRLFELGDDTTAAKIAEIIANKSVGEELTKSEMLALKNSEHGMRVYNEINHGELGDYTSEMSEEESDLFFSQYDADANGSASDYSDSFKLVLDLSKNKFTPDTVLEKKGVLTESQVGAIYKSTILDSIKSHQAAIDAIVKKYGGKFTIKGTVDDSIIDYTNSTTDGSKVNWKDINPSQRKAITFMSGFAKSTGMKLKLIDNGLALGINGAYSISNGVITLDIYAGMEKLEGTDFSDAIIPTASHEITHWMENKAPVLFRKIDELVFSTLTNGTLTEADVLAQRRRAMEKAHPGVQYSDADVRSEVIARACEDMLSMSKLGREMFDSLNETEKKTFVDKIKDIIQTLKDWVNEFLSHYKSKSFEAKTMRKFEERLNELSTLWDSALTSAIEANQALQKEGVTGEQLAKKSAKAQKNTTTEGDVQYDDRPFAEQVDDVLSGKDTMSTHLRISEHTPQILLDLGLSDKPLLITSTHTKTAVGKKVRKKNTHYISKEVFKELPKLIEKPAIIMESTTQGSIVMFVNAADVNHNPVMCSIKINGKGFYNNVEIESNVVTSVYGKDTNPSGFIERAVDEKRVLYWNKKMSQRLFGILRLQLPNNINNLDSNVIIRKINEKVKENDVKNSDRDSDGKTLSEGQIEFFKDSKVRDKKGNLLVMYRGDSSEFTVFDRKKSSYANLYGRGFYFTNSKAHAMQYGKAREFYLDIKNPLLPSQKNITKSQMLKFLKAIENDGEEYDLYNYGEGATAQSVLNSIWGKGDFEMLQDVSASAIGDLVAAVEMFNEVNGTSYDGIMLPTETITFNSSQAKLTSNENPTDDEDIRFSMRESIESTKDLVAIHNITPDLLIDALNRRGLLAPSLAITNKGHSAFGDISLLFNKSTIDPNMSEENKLYGSDAWTPTQTRLKKNAKFDTNKTVKAVRSIKKLIGEGFVSELFDINSKQFKETIIKADGSIYDAYAHNIGMQTAYAIEQGILSNVPTKANGTVDKTALQEQLNSVLDTDKGWREYKKWLNNISDTIITSYDAATNEDILDNMKAQPSTAKTFKLSVNGELVVPAVEYDSIDALRSNKNRLSENAEEATKSVATDLLSWAKKIGSDTKSVVNAINSAFAHRYDVAGIVNSFNESGIKISHKAATELQGLYKQAVELPTQYFEAKPQRAVGLEEIKAVVMPEQSTYDGDLSEIRAELEELGVPVIEYDYGSKESRVDALNSVDEVKFSDRDSESETLNELQRLRAEYSNARKLEVDTKTELDSIGDYPRLQDLFDIIVDENTSEKAKDEALAAYESWQTESGYRDAFEKQQTAQRQAQELRGNIERAEEKLSKFLREKTYSEDEIKAFVQKAVRKFHTTPYLNRASYLLTTGSMLDFSDGQGYRVKDHREIAEILDLPDYAQYSDGMVVFMNMGNIRLQTYGIDISAMPNNKQINSLRDIIYKVMKEYDEFTVDFSKRNGNSDGSVTYPQGVSSSKIISDIKNYFETGTVPEYEDTLSQFLYSDRDYTVTDNRAAFTEKHINDLYEDYSVSSTSDMMKDYAQAYVAYINPSDFLSLTAMNGEKVRGEAVELDLEKLQAKDERELPYLEFDEETGEVYEHDGRHRLVAFENAGIEQVAIRLLPVSQENKYHRKQTDITLKGQEFHWRNEKGEIVSGRAKGEIKVTAHPLSPSHRPVIERLFGTGRMQYSDRDNSSVYDLMGETDRLTKENAKLMEDIERLKERLKIERRVTNGNYFNENQLNAVAGHIRKIAGSAYSKSNLVALLKDVYSYVAHSPNLNWEDLFAQCYDVAETVLREAKDITAPNEYYQHVLKQLRGTRIAVNEKQIQNAKYHLGSKWRSHFSGRIVITDNAPSLDSMWKTWSGDPQNGGFPDLFDENISDADMLVELYRKFEDLKEGSEMVIEYDLEERTRWLAMEIYNQYWNVSQIQTVADKYDKQIKRLNFEHRKAMKDFRDSYEERLVEQRKADRTRYTELIRDIRERKDKEIAEVKAKSKERMDAYKENAERKTVMQRVVSKALTLNKWLVKNSKDEHIHEAMKGPVVNLLQAIDFSSKQMLGMKGTVIDRRGTPTQKDISFSKALNQVRDMLLDANVGNEELVALYGHDLDDSIKSLADTVDNIMRTVGDNEFVLNQMTLEELQTLDKIVSTIKQAVTQMNKFHVVNHAKGIANLSQEEIAYADELGKTKVFDPKTMKAKVRKLLSWDNANPFYAFKRFGAAGQKIFTAFQDGWDRLAFNAKKIIDFAKEAYTSKELKEWESDVKTFSILLPTSAAETADPNNLRYQSIQMSIPQIMSLYCLQKRASAKGHLIGGGIRVADIKKGNGELISQTDGFALTEKDIETIIGTLSSRQKEVADKLQNFMNTVCSDWGNAVSMARFGYRAFGEENYFPIQSDKNNLAVDDETEKNNSLFRLLNMSFTKSLVEGANNRIVISNIFDVFAQHTSDMAKYNALALPVLDAFRWYNYTEKEKLHGEAFITKSVKQSLEKAFGKDGKDYITNFLKDINGQQNVSRDTIGKGFFTNAKIASVALNLRVMLLQPTAFLKASAVINSKYLNKALLHKPKIGRAEKYCGMALWKSLGYYDTDISKGLTDQIKHEQTWKDKVTDFSMKGAEWADKITFGYLWNACELEIRETRKDLKVGSDEFFTEVGKRLREVIYATQVVDSTMTRSQIMRSGNMYEKMLTAFASEPTLAYNMLQDVYMEMALDGRKHGKKIAFKNHGKKAMRVLWAYTITNVVAALIESGFDIFRDDDEEETNLEEFMMSYLSNFANDMSIISKVPYLKEIASLIQGFTSSRSDTQWMESFARAIKGIWKISQGEGNPHATFKNILRGMSSFSGIAFYNVYRDLMAALNKLDILTSEEIEELFEDFIG